MKHRYILVLVLIFQFIIVSGGLSQNLFQRVIGGSKNEFRSVTLLTFDTNYIICFRSDTDTFGIGVNALMKIDVSGVINRNNGDFAIAVATPTQLIN